MAVASSVTPGGGRWGADGVGSVQARRRRRVMAGI
jgi:hypothetical protein